MTEAPDDLAQSVNSRAVHFTSLCENSDPILALTAAGSKGSASAPMKKIPATPVASAVRMIVPRFPGESMDSTASQNESRSGRTLAIGVPPKAITSPMALGSVAGIDEKMHEDGRKVRQKFHSVKIRRYKLVQAKTGRL
jgi:hypothetical protein